MGSKVGMVNANDSVAARGVVFAMQHFNSLRIQRFADFTLESNEPGRVK
jgi:hypothetical protein